MKLAQQAVSDKNFKFCLKLCSKCLDSIGPNEVIYDCAADAYIGLGKFSQAEICLLHALSLSDVPNIKYYINLISLVCIRGDFNLAFKYLERAASIDPSHEKLPEIRSILVIIALKSLSSANPRMGYQVSTGSMTFGIFYVASGSKYLKETVNSAQLSSTYLEGIPLSLCTDINDPSIDLSIFDRVLPLSSPEHSYRDKIVGLLDLPLNNLFLIPMPSLFIQLAIYSQTSKV